MIIQLIVCLHVFACFFHQCANSSSNSWAENMLSISSSVVSTSNTKLLTTNEVALCKYFNFVILDCVSRSAGKGHLVGLLHLSVNPSADIAATTTLDFRTISRKSLFG